MEFQLGPEIISSYKRLAYSPWFALAEFIDNSTQAYFNNRTLLDTALQKSGENLYVKIELGIDDSGEYLKIEDNSIGMSAEELSRAVILGRPPQITSGRSKYGVGLKTAACWFGNYWTIKTKKLGSSLEESIEVNVDRISEGNLDLNHSSISKLSIDEHYTIIEIRQLNRKLVGRTIGKIKEFLGSMYRRDFRDYNLKLLFNGQVLSWDYAKLDDRIMVDASGQKRKKAFSFQIGNKLVKGWAGVLETGSRSDAGFTILQNDRVIKGYPDSYRPSTLFGYQEGGSNDLVNQRLFGELELNEFDVSHTKDEILFTENDSDELEYKLLEELADLKQIALSYRKYQSDERSSVDYTSEALAELESEINSPEIADVIENYDLVENDLLTAVNDAILESVKGSNPPSLSATINSLEVSVYIVSNVSVNDPYVVIDSTKSKESVTILINQNHPHWLQLQNKDSTLNFIRHCIYDAISEWKAYFKLDKIEPTTVKDFKDKLLRVPLEIERHTLYPD